MKVRGMEQMDMFSLLASNMVPAAGGGELTFDELTKMVGSKIKLVQRTSAHEWNQIVTVARIQTQGKMRTLIYSLEGGYGLISEEWFDATAHAYPVRAYKEGA